MSTEGASHVATVVAAFLAAAGLGLSSYYAIQSQGESAEALRISRDSLALSQETALKGLAGRFYLGQAPDSLQPGGGKVNIRAVINANPVDIYQVWAEGTSGGKRTVVKMWTVQACTGYTLPGLPFEPRGVHFFDGSTYWYRAVSGALSKEAAVSMPSISGIDSPDTFTSLGCK